MIKNKYDKMFIGLLMGVLAPFIVFLTVYLAKFWGEYSLKEVLEQIQELDLASKIVALSVFLSNMILFYVMYRMRKDRICKGILWATFLYAFLVIYLKYL